ncbi:MAG: hypothetical protein CRU72_16785 [Candidatus Accumulibacter phosphatis]|nr:hypothetical protein [Candidatus Accumulibacter phosphatis]
MRADQFSGLAQGVVRCRDSGLVRTGGGTRWHGASKPVGAVIDAVLGHCRLLLLLRKRVSEQRTGVPVDVDL